MSSSNGQSSTTTQPSSILFFIAVAIGVVIAIIFVFFSMRYYVRTKLGIYATARMASNNGGGIVLVSGDFAMQSYTAYHNDPDRIRRRRRRRRYLKRRRLTEEEVDHLFPVRTYHDWLDGGAERDADNRDIHEQLKEEHDDVIEEQHESENNENVADEATHANDQTNGQVNDQTNDQTNDQATEASLDPKDIQVTHEEHVEPEASSSRNAGLSDSVVAPITAPTDHVDLGTAIHYDSGSCAICIDTFDDDDLVRGLICGHVFHQECLDPWLIKRKACCPMCKRDYYLKNNDSENNDEENNNDDDNISMSQFPELQYTSLAERVQEILSRNPEIEQVASNNMQRYLTLRWRIFWLIMGISKRDLINSAIAAEDTRIREAAQQEAENSSSRNEDNSNNNSNNTNNEANSNEENVETEEQRERNRARVEAIV